MTRSQPPLLGGKLGDRFDVVLKVSGIPDFDAEFASSVEEDLGGVRVHLLPLERILDSKRAAGRPKDGPGIHQIEIALKVRRKLEE